MKPLTRYAMGTGMNIEPHMAPWPEGPYYRVDQVDAVIRELEAERDAERADAERNRVNAERYEWLRNKAESANDGMPIVAATTPQDVPMLVAGKLDAAIDAARGAA